MQEEDRARKLRFWRKRLRTYSLPILIGLLLIPVGIICCISISIAYVWFLILGSLLIYVFLPIRREILEKLRELEASLED